MKHLDKNFTVKNFFENFVKNELYKDLFDEGIYKFYNDYVGLDFISANKDLDKIFSESEVYKWMKEEVERLNYDFRVACEQSNINYEELEIYNNDWIIECLIFKSTIPVFCDEGYYVDYSKSNLRIAC